MLPLLPALRLPLSPPTSSKAAAAVAALKLSSPAALLHQSPVQWPIPSRLPKRASHCLLRFRDRKGLVPCSMRTASGDYDDRRKLIADGTDLVHKLLDGLPQPVKNFPWIRVLWNFQNLILGLVLAVSKYLSVPLLALTSLSEMSYCAHERKMGLIPIPFVVGFALAGVARDAAVELSSNLKEGGFPWHLLLIGSFFTLLKLPGPYYPYWGRLLIPHFANGGLWRTVWLVFFWYRRPSKDT